MSPDVMIATIRAVQAGLLAAVQQLDGAILMVESAAAMQKHMQEQARARSTSDPVGDRKPLPTVETRQTFGGPRDARAEQGTVGEQERDGGGDISERIGVALDAGRERAGDDGR